MKIPEIKAKTIIQNKADKNHFWFGFDYNMNLYKDVITVVFIVTVVVIVIKSQTLIKLK